MIILTSKSCLKFLLVIHLVFLGINIRGGDASFTCYRCLSMDSSPSSKFQTNLRLLLSSLTSKAPSTPGFHMSSTGGAPDLVYGFSLCRSHVTPLMCMNCFKNITNYITQHCMNGKQGFVWYKHCLVCYTSNNSVGETDTRYSQRMLAGVQIYNAKFPPTAPPPPPTPTVIISDTQSITVVAAPSTQPMPKTPPPPTVSYGPGTAPSTPPPPTVSNGTGTAPSTPPPPTVSNGTRTAPSTPPPPTVSNGTRTAPSTPPPPTVSYGAGTAPSTPPATLPPSLLAPPPRVLFIEGPKPNPLVKRSNSLMVRIGILIGVTIFALVIIIVLYFVYKWRFSPNNPIFFRNKKTQCTHDVEMFLKNYGSLAPKRYKYSELKKITNSFRDQIGQGGYGGVFKGKLSNGRLVAVKVLSESKGNGEEFINEVASIGKTNHINVVSLLGFCFSGTKRALIYEYMPNGSLEKYIYGEKPRTMHPLGWEKLYQIALDIARGLEYLHLRCNMRILHLDIKPHNILLDENFHPKISDFGLAKLCSTTDSSISMLAPRGTFGYTAPEVHCRNFGGVSYKSDVYSYGMMVLEMVGGRKNIDVNVEKTSEIYFPQWIYKHPHQQGNDIRVEGLASNAKEEEIVRKMILISLWCIQMNPADRPSMSRVLEMFQGSIEALQMPPNPFISSQSEESSDSIVANVDIVAT